MDKLILDKEKIIREVYEKWKDKDFNSDGMFKYAMKSVIFDDMWNAIKKYCEE